MIETDRLLLREMKPEDEDELNKVWGDPVNMQYYPYIFDEERVRRWIKTNMERYHTFGYGLWAVILKETGELIGDCGLSMQLIKGQIKPEIGYHIRRDCHRKGYGTEAARACRDWAFEHTTYNILYSYMKYDNVGSYTTAIANGMKLVDEFADDVNTFTKVYAITRKEWEDYGKNN